MLPRPSTRRVRVVAAAVGGLGLLGATFTAGVVAGAASRPDPAPAKAGLLDDAADQIAGAGLKPVARETLDQAAIQGMLRAAGDQWGSWTDRSTGAARSRAGEVSVVYGAALPGGPAIARVAVPAFTRGVGREVRAALSAHPDGVVLDLRGNQGGLLDEAVETASVFLADGPVVSYTRRGGETVALDAVGEGDEQVPLVVLVDGGTASAAEVVAGALQDRGRAVLVGSRTFGKGTVQEPRTLADGSALALTVARYRTPAGRSLEGSGLEPDILVAPGLSRAVAERRASDVLTGLVADSGGGRG